MILNAKANVILNTMRTQEKRTLGGGLENYKEVATELQKMNRCPTGRHYRMTGPEQWKPWEKKYTCTKGHSKYLPPMWIRYCDITSNIF